MQRCLSYRGVCDIYLRFFLIFFIDKNTHRPSNKLQELLHSKGTIYTHTTPLPPYRLGEWLWPSMVEEWHLLYRHLVKQDSEDTNNKHSDVTGTNFGGTNCSTKEFSCYKLDGKSCWKFAWFDHLLQMSKLYNVLLLHRFVQKKSWQKSKTVTLNTTAMHPAILGNTKEKT